MRVVEEIDGVEVYARLRKADRCPSHAAVSALRYHTVTRHRIVGGIEARNKWKFETIEGLTGGMPVIENGRVTCAHTGDLYILVNLGANANAVENTLPHQLTHLAFDLMCTLKLDVSESEFAALLIGNLNEKWAPLIREEVERLEDEEQQ